MFVIGVILFFLAIGLAVAIVVGEHLRVVTTSKAGWIYFIAGEDGPVKVGMSAYEPTHQRLPELSTMSPVPLRVVFKAEVADRRAVEAALHAELAPYQEHGEWFDRDASLAYADHLREVMA